MIARVLSFRAVLSALAISAVLFYAPGWCSHQAASSAPVSQLTVSQQRIAVSDRYVNINLVYPAVSGMADVAFQSKFNSAVKAGMERLAMQLESDVKASYAQAQANGYPFRKHELLSAVEEYCNDGKIVSLGIRLQNYTGGAHGNRDSKFCLLLNEPSGKSLTLPQLFTEPDVGFERIGKYINGVIASHPDEYFPGAIVAVDANTWFYLHDNKLHIVFPTYSIAPYVAGEPEFSMPLSSLSDILIPELSH